ncbi:hypothetical protein VdG1_07646 [Verticillium dahliae VDG1]|nr:hypothetical protein VdG1_07646 [Verticillium dahliae VDG1]
MATEAPVGDLSSQLEKLNVGKLEAFPNSHPDLNPVDVYRSHIASLLHDVSGVEKSLIYNALQWTATLENGDLLLPVPALRFPESPLIEKPVPFNNGSFIQFWFKAAPLAQLVIPQIQQRTEDFGKNPRNGLRDPQDPSKGQKHMIVTRINYLGDWGKQYGLLALGYEKYGDEKALETDPINHLFQVYVKINNDLAEEKEKIAALEKEGKDASELKNEGLDEQARRYFKAMNDGEQAALAQWKKFRDLSIVRYKQTYAQLNVTFDEYSGESQVSEEDMAASAKTLEDKGISEVSDGAVVINFQKHVAGKAGKSLEKPVIKKSDGTALYLTRDISELLHREKKYNFDHMIYVVASQQDLHLKQLFKIIELMGYTETAKKVQHVNFGMVLGMSTRKGTVKFLSDIIRDVSDHMHDVMRKNEEKYKQVENPDAVAETLGISAIMVQDMTGKRQNSYTFSLEAMTSFEGDTGPYLQYAHARLSSIMRKANIPEADLVNADLSLLSEKHATELIRMLSQYPDTVQNTLKTLEPTTVLTYLFKLTHVLSSSYDVLRVVGSEPEVLKARLALYYSTRTVLANGMRLLGLSPVQRM